MSILACLLLLFVGLFCLWRRKLRAATIALVSSVLLVLAIGSGAVASLFLPRIQGYPTSSDVKWKAQNSIVLLGAGTRVEPDRARATVPFFGYGRIAAAAVAYDACAKRGADCKIVVSGGDPQHHGATEASVYAAALRALNVPQADLILEPKSNNTWQNAENSIALIPADRLTVVVTSGFQLKRALLYFAHFRDGVQGYASDYVDAQLSLIPTSQNFMITDVLLHEQIGIARYHFYNAMGWNAPKATKTK